MNPHSFRDGAAGRLMQVGRGDAAYWASVPNPLPPAWELDKGCILTLSEADRALGELAGLGRNVPNPNLLIGPFVRREAVLSSRIEGTQTGLAELYAFEVGQLPLPGFHGPPASDLREVQNYALALEYGLQRVETLPISLRLVRELHERLLHGVRGEAATPGEFRRTQNWIGSPGCTLNDASYVPPPVHEMREALSALEKYLHARDEHPPLVRLALVHYQFEAIHPFLDGNGRVGRLLTSLLLVQWKLLPLPLLYLSAFFEKHRQEYYNLLLAVSQSGLWSEWVEFFLRGVSEQARDAIARAKRLQDLQREWQLKLRAERATGLVLDILDRLFETPIISANEATRAFHVSHQAVMPALRRLEQAGFLHEITGRQRRRVYIASEIVRTLE
jgi:Fic family protein